MTRRLRARRWLRRNVPSFKVAILVPFHFSIGYLSGACLRESWVWAVMREELLPAAVALGAAVAFFGLSVLSAAEIGAYRNRLVHAVELDDAQRCAICDTIPGEFIVRVNRSGRRRVCVPCVRTSDAQLARVVEQARTIRREKA